MNCNDRWRSVRKVRYLDDIEAAARYASQYGDTAFSEEILTSHIITKRQDRHNLVQKHYKKGIQRTKKSMYETKFRITLPDTLTFLREIKILAVTDGLVRPLELAKKMKGVSIESRKRKLVMKYVLNSKYKAYECFLRHLVRLGKFVLSAEYSRRDMRARAFINRSGFLTDIVSFYTIRDLFYELDAINWYVDDENNEVIYPVVSIGEENKNRWTEQLSTKNLRLNLRKKIDEKLFLRELIEIYLNLTGRRFMINTDLLQVRDSFCSKYSLGDHYFKEMLLKLYNKKSLPYRVLLNFGSIRKRKRNYNLKIVSLPKLSSNRLALYIAIDKEVVW